MFMWNRTDKSHDWKTLPAVVKHLTLDVLPAAMGAAAAAAAAAAAVKRLAVSRKRGG